MALLKNSVPYFLAVAVILCSCRPAAAFTNFLGMRFVDIPAGAFFMGSCKLSKAEAEENRKREYMGEPPRVFRCPAGGKPERQADDDETPQHHVRITRGFQLGTHEVTLGQFKRFITEGGRGDLLSEEFRKHNSQGDEAAVSYVSWNDVQDFIKWLNHKEGGQRYRLPTEAEWEYAARAGSGTVYSWGKDPAQALEYGWFAGNAYDRGEKHAHPVGLKKANPWGLFDMHGNVAEWVQDWYGEKYYRVSPASDPSGPERGRYRVYRGGSWMKEVEELRSANRGSYSCHIRDDDVGFRLLRQY